MKTRIVYGSLVVMFLAALIIWGGTWGVYAVTGLIGALAFYESTKLFGKIFSGSYLLAGLFSLLLTLVPLGALALHADLGRPEATFPVYLAILLIGTKAQDIFAYFAGKFFGKHKLAPQISPKKTIEGAVGGVLGSVAVTYYLVQLWQPADLKAPLIYGMILGFGSLAGDLIESALKRKAGIKDSGSLLPEFGGILDMVDSFILVAPLSLIYLKWSPL